MLIPERDVLSLTILQVMSVGGFCPSFFCYQGLFLSLGADYSHAVCSFSHSVFLSSDGEEETEDGGGIFSLLRLQTGSLRFTALE